MTLHRLNRFLLPLLLALTTALALPSASRGELVLDGPELEAAENAEGVPLLEMVPQEEAGEFVSLEEAPCPSTTCCNLRCCKPRPQDQVWLVSTRHLGCPRCGDEPNLRVWLFNWETNQWEASSLEAFYASDDPAVNTLVNVHGNRVDWCTANREGWEAYRAITCCGPEAPVRYVIWSWPASQIKGILKDLRTKAARCDSDGWYLGWFLGNMNPEVQVGLVGYSFGARIVTGALHVNAGGRMAGQMLPTEKLHRKPSRVVLCAAALHNNWLIPGSYHGRAYMQIDHMLCLNNGCDPITKRYRFVFKGSRPAALGYTGIAGLYSMGETSSRIQQRNLCGWIGKTHDWEAYFHNPGVVSLMRPYLLWYDLGGGSKPAGVELVKAAE